MSLPGYFYSLDATLPDGTQRWRDEFKDDAPSIIQPRDLSRSFLKAKNARNEAYARWMASFFYRDEFGDLQPSFKPKQFNWQAIRVLAYKHSESRKNDWWEHYQDAVFRVFVQPETVYDGLEHKQWYLLSPEDCYLVNLYILEKLKPSQPPRDRTGHEKYLSATRALRNALFIPVECCHHLRHETTAGVLPEGL